MPRGGPRLSAAPETHELKIRFARDAAGAAVKRDVLAWLAAQAVTNVAEGMIDGIEEELASDDADAAFGDDDASPVVVFDYDEAALSALERALLAAFGPGVATTRAVLSTEAWSQAWNEQAATIVTERFRIEVVADVAAAGDIPSVHDGDGRTPLIIGSGAAFGSGRHATTEVCLRLLESLEPPQGGRRRLPDVGTGTGILALAAATLGFNELVGTEIADEALAEARQNAARQDVALHLLLTESLPSGEFEVVVANILAPVLHQLMPQLAMATAPGGRLLLAGFIDKEATPLIAAAARVGLSLRRQLDCRGWIGLEFER